MAHDDLAPGPRSGGRARSAGPTAARTVVVRVAGDLDLEGAQALEVRVGRALRAGAREVRLDLSAVDFVDSSGLQGLMWATSATPAGQRVRVVSPSEAVERLLRMTGLAARLSDSGGT